MKWYTSSNLRNEIFVQGQESELYRAKVAALYLDDALQYVLGSSARLTAAEVESGLVRVHFDHPTCLSPQQLRAIEIDANRAAIMDRSKFVNAGPVCIVDQYRIWFGLRWIAAETGMAAVETNQRARETLASVADIIEDEWEDVPDVPDEVTKLLSGRI